jgi:hypothetical protein
VPMAKSNGPASKPTKASAGVLKGLILADWVDRAESENRGTGGRLRPGVAKLVEEPGAEVA